MEWIINIYLWIMKKIRHFKVVRERHYMHLDEQGRHAMFITVHVFFNGSQWLQTIDTTIDVQNCKWNIKCKGRMHLNFNIKGQGFWKDFMVLLFLPSYLRTIKNQYIFRISIGNLYFKYILSVLY